MWVIFTMVEILFIRIALIIFPIMFSRVTERYTLVCFLLLIDFPSFNNIITYTVY